MSFFEKHYKRTIKQDLINKFNYKNIEMLPKITTISLNFYCNTSEIKQLAVSMLALELLGSQKGILSTTKKPNITLKIKKGQPVGCNIKLNNKNKFIFLEKLISQALPKIRNFKKIKVSNKQKVLSYNIPDNFCFSEIETNYHLFNQLKIFNISIGTNTTSVKELLFLLKSFQTPVAEI